MSIEGKETLSHEEVDIYMERLEMRSRETIGKSIEYLWALAGGAEHHDGQLRKEYEAWKADSPLESSIWDEIRSSSALPMSLEDWKSWWKVYEHNHELLSRLSKTFKKLDRHIDAMVIKQTFRRCFEDMTPEIARNIAIPWNLKKGFSTGNDAFEVMAEWIMNKALDGDVIAFNKWASRSVPLWSNVLGDLMREFMLYCWWGRGAQNYAKALGYHFGEMDAYNVELKNAIRIYALRQDGIRNWFLKEFSSKGITPSSISFIEYLYA